jgi:protein gp37
VKGKYNGLTYCRVDNLDFPLRTKKPVSWLILNDGFHPDVSFDFLQAAMARTTNRPKHTFLWLTKRPQRMLEFGIWNDSADRAFRIQPGLKQNWFGVTVCNQQEADEKIPILLKIPAAVHWVSLEPLLGPIKFDPIWLSDTAPGLSYESLGGRIKWVVLGGESGPGARPMKLEWVRNVRDNCQWSGVPFFFKQWGEFCPPSQLSKESYQSWCNHAPVWNDVGLDVPFRVGRKAAGRILDGRTWDGFPR